MQILLQTVTSWVMRHGVKTVLIVIIAFVFKKIIDVVVQKALRKGLSARRHDSKEAAEKRANTLIKIFRHVNTIAVSIIATLMILSEFGIDTAPLLAAAGITGLALGFGGQYLIKDVISGLFIIIENQYRIGDVVCFDGTCGLVEDITLRMTVLRDLDGTVHHVPHGVIDKTANLSKRFARVNLNVSVSYGVDIEKVISVINRVGQDLANDPAWKEQIVSAPQFLRVDDFAASGIVIKILGDTKPLKQWDVTGELRKRLKIAFDKEKIEIPFPQMVVHQAGSMN